MTALPKNILAGLEQVHIDIDLCLQSSSEVLTEYRSLVDNALCSYQLDMGRLEAEYEQQRGSVLADEEENDTWSGVFEEENDKLEEEDEVKDEDSLGDLTVDFGPSNKIPTTKEEKRLESVSGLVDQLNALSAEEEDILAKLKPSNNGLTFLSVTEKETLTKKLTQIRANQSMAIVASCKDFNPSYKSVIPNNAFPDTLNFPKIKDILNEAVNSPKSSRHIKSAATSSRGGRRTPKKSAPARLTTHYTNKHETETNVLTNQDNFDSLGELAVSSSGDNLATLVQTNTRRLNCMKLGRRNRVSRE